MDAGRRPVTADEVPHLARLGETMRGVRRAAGLTQAELARRASLAPQTVSGIERGLRRTRRSTLERLAAGLVADDDQAAELVERLVAAAGPALAPESDYAERVERRRHRREARDLPRLIAEAERLLADLRRMAKGPLAVRWQDQIERTEADLKVWRARLAEVRAAKGEPGPATGGPTPAVAAYRTFVHRVTGGRPSRTVILTAEERAELAELRAAMDAEAAGCREVKHEHALDPVPDTQAGPA